MKPIILENSVDIILTPQFYTFLREDLDLKFAYQAKQIAPSLFDDYLNNNDEYQYYVYKCNNQWCFFAYNIEEIDLFLESVGIEKHRVSKIYFAQQISDKLDDPILIGENSVLQNIDDTVTLIPKRLMNPNIEYKELDTKGLKLKGGVTMGASLNSFISLKETIILSSLFVMLGTVFIVEGNRIKSSIANEDAKLTQLLDDNPKYGSTILRNSILEKYKPIDTHERKKRDAIKEISKLLSAKSQLKKLSVNEKSIKADIVTLDTNINKQVKEHARNKNFKVSGSGKNVKVEKQL
jgi:hypothetical protein